MSIDNKINSNQNNLLYLNIESLLSHKSQLDWIINKMRPALICVSETHITEDIEDSELEIEGYSFICSYSTSRFTGGAIIYIKD